MKAREFPLSPLTLVVYAAAAGIIHYLITIAVSISNVLARAAIATSADTSYVTVTATVTAAITATAAATNIICICCTTYNVHMNVAVVVIVVVTRASSKVSHKIFLLVFDNTPIGMLSITFYGLAVFCVTKKRGAYGGWSSGPTAV